MSDGKVIIEVELNDGQAVRGISDIDKRLNGLDPSARKADNSIKDMVTSLGLVKLASAGFDILNRSLDAAISRFDTMESFPKVMESLGFSTEESSEAVNKLADGIDGLPTKLDEVVSTTKRMASITGDLNKSTDATLALNNAMLASGASTSDAARGMDQYIQMLSTGKVDLQSWKTLQETMPIGLQKTAEAMGFLGETAQRDLYGALQEGDITFKEFQNQLIELGTGTGELAELAKINSEGIATSFGNLRNTASKGLANIIKDLDNLSVAVTGKNIAKNLDSLKVLVNQTFIAVGKSIQGVTPIIILATKGFGMLLNAIEPLIPAIISFVAVYATLKIIESVNQMMKESVIVTKAMTVATKLWELATQAQSRAELAAIAVSKIQNIVLAARTALVGAQITMTTALAGTLGAQTVATALATAATIALNAAMTLLTGPIGVATLVIGSLVAVAASIWTWFNKDTEATAKLRKEQEELDYSTKQLNDSTKQAALSRKEALSSIDSTAEANKGLVKSVTELADKEKLSAGEKKQLKEQVEQLNKAYTGLNLKYDEETQNLSMSTEALNKKIEAQKEQSKLTVGQEQLLEIAKEQAEVDLKLAETAELRKKYNEQLDGSWKEAHKAKGALKELDETEESLKETAKALGEEHDIMSKVVSDASNRAAQAIQESAALQRITYESLSEDQQKAVDSMQKNFQSLYESATNAFSKINTESEISMAQMVENMAHNQEAVRQWGENQAALLEWAGKTGHDSFIPFIESIGVDQAGVLAQMVQGLDGNNVEQAALLEQLAVTYDEGFGKAAQAGKDSMKYGLEGLPDEIKDMIITPVTSMNQEARIAFEGFGKNVGEGAKQGIDASAKGAAEASENMAKEVDDKFTGHMQIKSPSRLFKGHGENIGIGLSLGIVSQVGIVTASINMISDAIKRPFDSLPINMTTIGLQAMQGLNLGLQMGAGSVYATADNIAQNVKRTIQSAMDIHSPSRWMKNFIGKNMMIGWSDGLEKYGDLPVNALEKAINMVKLPVLSAEMLVGNMPSMSLAGVNQSSNNTTNNYQSDFEGFMRGAIFNVRDDSDIERIADELLRKQQLAEAQRGVRRIR